MDFSPANNSQDEGVALWPLAGRDQLSNVYRPGSQPGGGPLRTLRLHKQLSDGVRIPLVERNRLSGQVRIFCSLNLDAARWARHGDAAAAVAAAAAAAEVEHSTEFRHLCAMLATHSPAEIRLLAAGNVAAATIEGELGSLLWHIAVQTERARAAVRACWQSPWEHTTAGWVFDRQDDFVTMSTSKGYRTKVPLEWALKVHRADTGQALVLIIEELDNVVIHSIFPGLWLSGAGIGDQPHTSTERPAIMDVVFGGPRAPRVFISNSDADRLEESEPLRVLTPVAITE